MRISLPWRNLSVIVLVGFVIVTFVWLSSLPARASTARMGDKSRDFQKVVVGTRVHRKNVKNEGLAFDMAPLKRLARAAVSYSSLLVIAVGGQPAFFFYFTVVGMKSFSLLPSSCDRTTRRCRWRIGRAGDP